MMQRQHAVMPEIGYFHSIGLRERTEVSSATDSIGTPLYRKAILTIAQEGARLQTCTSYES